MDDITLNLIVLAVLTLLGSLIFLLVRQKQAQSEQELLQLAAEQGWEYESIREALAWGLRLTSPRWTLEALSRSSGQEAGPGSSDVAMQTVWHAPAPGSTFLLGARTSQAELGGLGEMLTRQVLQLALGADANGLTEIHAGSADFQKKYLLWAQNPADVRISPALETTLLNWKSPQRLIKRTSEGLTIELRGVRLSKLAEIRALVDLGDQILTSLK